MKKRKSGRKNILFPVLIAICLLVMGISLYKLITITLDYKKGEQEYDMLKSYTTERKEDTPDSSQEAEEEVQTEEEGDSTASVSHETCPVSVDFKNLQLVNPDLVCWLYIPVLDLSYPVVQGRDNDWYLHRTFEGTDNFAGSIFVDATIQHPFEDPHTIVYGHSMKNLTMFGKLKLLLQDELYKKDPVFWILTPEGDRKYQMLDIRYTEAGSDTYTIFEQPDEAFVTYLNEVSSISSIENAALPEISENCRLVTLSTCAAAEGTSRLVVQGIRVEEP